MNVKLNGNTNEKERVNVVTTNLSTSLPHLLFLLWLNPSTEKGKWRLGPSTYKDMPLMVKLELLRRLVSSLNSHFYTTWIEASFHFFTSLLNRSLCIPLCEVNRLKKYGSLDVGCLFLLVDVPGSKKLLVVGVFCKIGSSVIERDKMDKVV